MEPIHNSYGPPTELPRPTEGSSQDASEKGSTALPEKRAMQAPAAVPSVPPPALPDSASLQAAINNAVTPTVPTDNSSTAALMADDADLIEKEWVLKAKAIVTQTRDDPYKQNREMSKVKADYLKKRYNKDLKLSEET